MNTYLKKGVGGGVAPLPATTLKPSPAFAKLPTADRPSYVRRSVVLDAPTAWDYSSCSSPRSSMRFPRQCPAFSIMRFLLSVVPCLFFALPPALCQDSSAEGTLLRGDRPELSVTVRDSSGEPISSLASVKVLKDGVPTDQKEASHGRAFFILRSLGDYTLVVAASGYKTAQKDVSVPIAVKAEVDIVLQRDSSSSESTGVPGKPLLAPKAKEALDKGLQALGENKPEEAEKFVDEAAKLAPGHPDVLFVQGVLYLNLRNWAQAQGALEKAAQMDPGNARVLAALGMALTDQGKYGQAIPPLEKSLQMETGGWETHWALGKSYYYRQQYDRALKTSQLALTESNGKAPQIELLVAQSLTAVGRYDDAAQALRDFLKNHGNRPEAATAKRWLDGLAKNGKIR
jgi:Flp pilus assembly protein TadD